MPEENQQKFYLLIENRQNSILRVFTPTEPVPPGFRDRKPEDLQLLEIPEEQAKAIQTALETPDPQRGHRQLLFWDSERQTTLTLEQKRQQDLEKMRAEQQRRSQPAPPTLEDILNQGIEVQGILFDASPQAQAQWTAALVALDNAEKVTPGFDADSIPVQSLIGPVLDKNGTPVETISVTQFRVLMAQLAQAIGQKRTSYFASIQQNQNIMPLSIAKVQEPNKKESKKKKT